MNPDRQSRLKSANRDVPSIVQSREQFETFLKSIISRTVGDSERKQARSKRREQQILRAALRVFAREGISGARINDIALEAGLPLASIYSYFPSKQELAYAVPTAQFERFYLEYMQAVSGMHTNRERLYTYLWLTADFVRRNKEWARTLHLEIWPSVLVINTPIRRMIDDYFRVVVHLIRLGGEASEWRVVSKNYELAAVLVGSVNQIIIGWLLYRRPRDLMKAIESVIQMTMKVLRSRSKAAQSTAEKRMSARVKR